MKTRLAMCFALAVGLLMVYGRALAHHGSAAFDTSKQFEMNVVPTGELADSLTVVPGIAKRVKMCHVAEGE